MVEYSHSVVLVLLLKERIGIFCHHSTFDMQIRDNTLVRAWISVYLIIDSECVLLQDADIRLVVIGQSAHHHIEVICFVILVHNFSRPQLFLLC